jgi:hypothetical protein
MISRSPQGGEGRKKARVEMRQAVRVYAIVALVVMAVVMVGLWARPGTVVGGQGWVSMTLALVVGLQPWVLLVIPLGVLAASAAARAGQRGWLALFIALIVLAPFAAWLGPLSNNISLIFIPPCFGGSACLDPYQAPEIAKLAGWAVAFLGVPLAALVYSLTAARSAAQPTSMEASQGERRALIVCAIVGLVIVSALGYLGNLQWSFPSLAAWFGGHGSFGQTAVIFAVLSVLFTFWVALAALPVAVVSLALAHAARTGRRSWLAGWSALAALAWFTAALGSFWGGALILMANGAMQSNEQQLILQPYQIVSVVGPAVIMLAALVYALTVMRPPPQRAAALAIA